MIDQPIPPTARERFVDAFTRARRLRALRDVIDHPEDTFHDALIEFADMLLGLDVPDGHPSRPVRDTPIQPDLKQPLNPERTGR